MNQLDYIICNSNLMLVKDTLDKLTSKLLKSDKVNKPLVNELKADRERLNDSYLYFNQTKEIAFSVNNKNKQLESLILDARVYILDLKKENKELKTKNGLSDEVMAENLKLKAELEEFKSFNIDELISKNYDLEQEVIKLRL